MPHTVFWFAWILDGLIWFDFHATLHTYSNKWTVNYPQIYSKHWWEKTIEFNKYSKLCRSTLAIIMSTDFLGSGANTNCEHLLLFFDSFHDPTELNLCFQSLQKAKLRYLLQCKAEGFTDV